MPERTIYVIRHGSTALNEAGRSRGWSNVELSPEGREEVKRLGSKLARSNIKVIFHSDLDRATDTARAVADATGAKSYGTRLLRPWNLGDFTGRSSSEVHPKITRMAEEHPGVTLKNGESFENFKQRAFKGLHFALANSDGLPLALVTHHRVERLLQAWAAMGQPRDHEIDLGVMFQHGEDPAHAEKLTLRDVPEGANVKGPDRADGGENGGR